MKGKRKNFSPVGIVRDNSVPVLFIIICLIMIPLSGFSPSYVLNEVMTRLGRNSFMILSLLIPIMAGMGLNFGMTLGAMAGEIGLILVADWQIWGIPGLILAAIISIPISVLLGLMCGKILNRAKGREMITSYFIAFFMGGVYQLVVLYMMGPIIPIAHNSLKLPRGYGIRNTVSLLPMRQSIDNALAVYVGGVKIPVLTLIIIALACLFIVWFRKTKLGQDMRAVGQDMEVARDAGINVERTRIISIVMSTVFAGFGMIIYLQNMGNFPTYTAHTNVGMFCIAALLVGGASVEKASIGNVFLGVILFHTMFVVAPFAGTKITGDSMIGEYFRVFISYAVITVALVMYEAKKRKSQSMLGQMLAQAQLEEEGKTE
jgi:simple sugar transport system permease protein